MRRSATFTLAWLVAAGVATTAAWQGVALVTSEVTDDRPAPLAAADVRAELDGPVTTVPGTAAPSTTTPTAPTVPATPTTAPEQAVTRTYSLVGGTAALRFTPSGVTVLWATPKPGFSLKSEPENGTGWRVQFESESHRSRVDGWWDGGPQDREREDPR